MKLSISIDTDHFQFHLKDEASQPNYKKLWNDRNLPFMLAIAPGIIAVGTARYGGKTEVTIEVLQAHPRVEFPDWDQVVQCSMLFPTGRLVLATPKGGAVEESKISVAPGIYQAFVLYGKMDKIAKGEHSLQGDDHYEIILWPDEKSKVMFLKKWRKHVKE